MKIDSMSRQKRSWVLSAGNVETIKVKKKMPENLTLKGCTDTIHHINPH